MGRGRTGAWCLCGKTPGQHGPAPVNVTHQGRGRILQSLSQGLLTLQLLLAIGAALQVLLCLMPFSSIGSAVDQPWNLGPNLGMRVLMLHVNHSFLFASGHLAGAGDFRQDMTQLGARMEQP